LYVQFAAAIAFATDFLAGARAAAAEGERGDGCEPTTAAAPTAQIQRGSAPRPPPLRVSTRFFGA
jgi:hypothetical protein